MQEETSDLRIDETEKGYVLSKPDSAGNIQEIELSEIDVIKIAQSAPLLQDHILAKRSRPGATLNVYAPVAGLSLDLDMQGLEILLVLQDPNRKEARFSLPLQLAEPLAQKMTEAVRIAKAQSDKSVQ